MELVHWVHQIWQASGNDLHRVVSHYGLDAAQLEKDITVALAELPNGASSINDFSHLIELAVERAWVYASLSMNDRSIRGAWLLAAALETPELRRALLGISAVFQKIPVMQMAEDFPLVIAQSSESESAVSHPVGEPVGLPGEASAAFDHGKGGQSALEKYATDLTALAATGQIDPVIGREHEIRNMVDILLRRRQNNPLLTGEAGVGKTAVVEGLALAIAAKAVPPALVDVRLMSLDVGALLAGASMRGEFESRLKAVLQEASASTKPVLLFIDEVHTLVGAGGQAGTGDAANLLKPALARGNLRAIGATTWSEFKKHIEKDPALTRRFQVIQVQEPQEASAVAMVRGLVETFSKHHGVAILDEAVRAAVNLSHRYIPARQLPDKAISLLDTACARVAMSLHTPGADVQDLQRRMAALTSERDQLVRETLVGKSRSEELEKLDAAAALLAAELTNAKKAWAGEHAIAHRLLELRATAADCVAPDEESQRQLQIQQLTVELALLQGEHPRVHIEVDAHVVGAIVADWTGIPVGRMVRDDVTQAMGLEQRLRKRVVGQDDALARLCERVKTSKAKLRDPGKPVGTFLLVGPSGVGKTETALALAEAMYGGEQNLITINMSEYQEAHTVSSLKGSPPGYVGYGEGGVLTEAVRRKPYSVILLDEVEKAHPDVHEVFYQVFDKGWMEDGEGRVIDFKNTLILLTSNTGAELISQLCDDRALMPESDALADALQPELRKVFPAAFLGRLSVIPYLPLPAEILESIVQLQLKRVAQRMHDEHGIDLKFSGELVSHIVARCGMQESGARRLAQFIEQNLLPPLAHVWLVAMQDRIAIQAVEVDTKPRESGPDSTPQQLHIPPKAGMYFRFVIA